MVPVIPKSSCDCFRSIITIPAQHKRIFLVLLLLLLLYTSTGKNANNNHFDYFVFSQRWLPTACIEYVEHSRKVSTKHLHLLTGNFITATTFRRFGESGIYVFPYGKLTKIIDVVGLESSSGQRQCILPRNYDFWAIHGLWPTQQNHLGPFFCNRSIPFNIKKLLLIEADLKLYWPNIEEGKGMVSLWNHEWDKHGTCAVQLESLNNELKYFNTTLNFFKAHNIQEVLEKKNVLPTLKDGIRVSDLFYTIEGAFGKEPRIHCINEVKNNKPYLSEIRLCYNKNLELMDCGNISKTKFYSNEDRIKVLTNCPLDRKIIYPDKIISTFKSENSERVPVYDILVDILRLIQFIQWVSI